MGAYKMRKKILAGIVILSLITSLMACGRSEAQKVETTPDTPVVEEAKAEPEPEPEPVVEEKEPEEIEEEAEEVEEEPEKDYIWVNTYIDYLNHLDYSEGFNKGALIYVNDDFIPEIILQSHSDENFTDYSNYMALTVNEDEVETLYLYGNNTLSYLHRENKLLMQLYQLQAGSGTDNVYSIVDNKWNNLFKGEYDGSGNLDPNAEPNSAAFIYYVGKEVSEEEYYSQLDLAYDESKAEIVDFKYSIDELKQELVNLLKEATAEKYKDAEPWKLTYRDCLYNIMNKIILLGEGYDGGDWNDYGNDMIFTLYDITGDGIPELLASGDWPKLYQTNPYWNIFFYDGNDGYKHDFFDNMEFYDTDTNKIYSWGSILNDEWYTISVYRNGEEETCVQVERAEDDERIYENPALFPEGCIYTYTEYEEDGEEKISKEITKEDWNLFVAKYNAGIEKYGIKDYYDLTLKNIDIALGVSSGTPEKKEEMANNDDKSDSTLYSVEVTAPDGYVNLRNGAGTDNAIITSISNGETLLVYEEANSGKWLKVEYQGNEGWVAASQVTKK